uniref:Ig-like domain-containing protein n=1 Tax=Aceria tosichella TaxID=561515 RepID=A0A6G1SHZ8_9ACAR
MRIQIRMAKKMAIQEASGKLLIVLLILIKLTNGERNVIKPSEQTTRRLLTKRHNEKDHPPLEFESYDQQSSDQIAPSIQLHQNHHFQQDTAAATPTSLSLISSSHPQLPEPFALVQQQQQQQPSLAASASGKPLVRTVNPGDRVNIPCSLANMGGSIQFAKDDQPIILDSGCAHCQLDISNDGQASLTINRVSQRDQGHWQCWRLDAHGKVKQKIPIVQLAVTNSPELPILIVNDKELLGGNNLDATITIKENEIVTFKCIIKAASTPVDYVHWILDSSTNVTEMSELRMDYSPLENNYNTQSVLRLNATKAMNMKPISCLSNHQLWLTPMTVTALLNVLYEPSFTISREPGFGVPVSEGMTVILKCEIDSNPSSSPIWIKDADNRTSSAGGQDNSQQQQQPNQINGKESSAEPIVLDTQDDGSVVFQPVRQSDSAWYRCKTENKYGNFSSFGYYLNVRPAGSSGSQPNGVGAGSSPAQQAQHPSYQRPRSDSRIMGPNQAAAGGGGGPPLASFPAHQMSSLVSSAQQTVRPLLHQDINTNTQRSQLANDQPQPMFGGNQLLAAAHSQAQQASSASSSFDNAELPAAAARCRSNGAPPLGHPEIKSPVMSVQAVLGRQLILPLRFCCQPSPARVFWIHRHLAMIPGRMFGPYITREVYPTYNSAHCYETTFEIEQVKPEDIGTVYVFVSNDKGHAGAQIHIQLAKQLTSSTTTGQSPSDLHNSQFNSMQTNLGSRFQFAPASSSSPSSLAGAPRDFIKSKLPFVWLAILMVVATIIQLAATTQNHYQVSEHHHSQPHSTVPRRRDPENPSGVARLIRTPGAQLTDRFASIQRHHHHHDQHHNHHHHSHYHHNQRQHHHHRH